MGESSEGLTYLLEAQADTLGDTDEGDPAQRFAPEPSLAPFRPFAVEQALLFVEPQSGVSNAGALDHVSDGQPFGCWHHRSSTSTA